MKVRNTGTIFAFNITDEHMQKLNKAAGRSGLRLRVVLEEDQGKPLYKIAGLSAPAAEDSAEPPAPFADEMIVMHSLSEADLNQFLIALRHEELSIPYKAILTPTNMNWFPGALITELRREHEAMQKTMKQ